MPALTLAFALAIQDPPRIEMCETQRNTLEMNECGAARVALERARMDRYLAAARDAMAATQEMTPPEYEVDLLAELTASQTAFEAYAQAQCNAVYDSHIGGTIRSIMYLGCMEDMVFQRTDRIWLDFLSDVGPDLERPVAPAADAVLGE